MISRDHQAREAGTRRRARQIVGSHTSAHGTNKTVGSIDRNCLDQNQKLMSASALLAARSSWHLISGRNLVRFAIDCALRALFRHSCRFLRGKMAKLNHLRPLVSRQVPTGVTKRQTKKADPIYGLPEHRAWRAAVLRRAGFRCEAIEDARRCPRMAPQYRLEADHIIEIADGGSRYDLTNGQCLCRHHHKLKTDQAQAKRAMGMGVSA